MPLLAKSTRSLAYHALAQHLPKGCVLSRRRAKQPSKDALKALTSISDRSYHVPLQGSPAWSIYNQYSNLIAEVHVL